MSPRLPKAQRRKLVTAELLMHLATSTERWAHQVQDDDGGTLPFDQWPDDDPLVALARTYDLTPDDLAGVLRKVGGRLEAQAVRAGYDDTLDR